jgi:formylglycine-generating enzyme required for sulfatase activity
MAVLGNPTQALARLALVPDPRVRSHLIDQFGRLGVNPRLLIDRLPTAAELGQRQGLLMALAESARGPEVWSTRDRDAAIAAARLLLGTDPDPGVHSAAELLLRRLGRDDLVRAALGAATPANAPAPGQGWFIGPNGHTFAVTGPLQGWVGTPENESNHGQDEVQHYVQTSRALAVATTEVTIGQYRTFLDDNPDVKPPNAVREARDTDMAAGHINWYNAVRYCNWLSARAGLPACYPEPVAPGLRLEAGALDRPGYRLPTEAEWELFCRAGSTTARPFESADELLPRYAWTWLNSDDHTQHVARLWPNRLGLFDVLGNQWEWCHDGLNERRRATSIYPPGTPEHPAADQHEPVTIAGAGDANDATPPNVRAQRGGAFDYAPKWSRSGARYFARVFIGDSYSGLRVVRTLNPR